MARSTNIPLVAGQLAYAPAGTIVDIFGVTVRNNGASPTTVILHNGTSTAGPIMCCVQAPGLSGTAPGAAELDLANPRYSDQGVFVEFLGTTTNVVGSIWVQ
jgi:hypothetical protein